MRKAPATNCRSAKKDSGVYTTAPMFGYESAQENGFGFHASPKDPVVARHSVLACLRGMAHVLSIGLTGAGKTILAIANLLLYRGSAIVIDVRGDIARATARFRRKVLGQEIHVLDPFNVTGILPRARLDPLDIIRLPGTSAEIEGQTIAGTLAGRVRFERDPFWHEWGATVSGSLISHLLSHDDSAKRSFPRLLDILFSDDAVYQLAVLMDTEIKKQTFAYEGIGAFLQLPDGQGNTRGCVLATVHAMLHAFRCQAARESMQSSTVDLLGLLEGKPMTIYLVLPVERMESHGVLLRLWLDILLQVLIRRVRPPAIPTMVVVDEAAQLGPCPALKTVATYLRASGVRLWTFWQDLSQIKALYPDWQTLVNNTSAITFMPGTGLAARELATMVGVAPGLAENLASDEQLVCEVGSPPRIVRMAQYWKDPLFAGRFDQIPRFSSDDKGLNR